MSPSSHDTNELADLSVNNDARTNFSAELVDPIFVDPIKASLYKRIISGVIDGIILSLMVTVFNLILIVAVIDPLSDERTNPYYLVHYANMVIKDNWITAVFIFLFFSSSFVVALYKILFTWKSGQTIGKKIMHIRVTRPDGETMNFMTSLHRWLPDGLGLYVFPLLIPIWIGNFLVLVWDKSKRLSLYDRFAGTEVLEVSHV